MVTPPMPITKSAKKALRASKRKRVTNIRRTRAAHEAVKDIRKLLADKDVAGAKAAFKEAQSAIDKAAKKGVIKKNTAARKKSRLSALLKRS